MLNNMQGKVKAEKMTENIPKMRKIARISIYNNDD